MADYLIDSTLEPSMDSNFSVVNRITLLELNSNTKFTIDSSYFDIINLAMTHASRIFRYYFKKEKFYFHPLSGGHVLIDPTVDTILFGTSFEEHFRSINLLFSSHLVKSSRDMVEETPDLLKGL